MCLTFVYMWFDVIYDVMAVLAVTCISCLWLNNVEAVTSIHVSFTVPYHLSFPRSLALAHRRLCDSFPTSMTSLTASRRRQSSDGESSFDIPHLADLLRGRRGAWRNANNELVRLS